MNKKHIKIVLIVFFIGVSGVAFCLGKGNSEDEDVILKNESTCDVENDREREDDNSTENDKGNDVVQEENESVFVHVCGEVKEPGVYELAKTSRVVDAIKAANGFTKDAAGDYINQAMQVSDSQQVYVPSKKEIEDGTIKNSSLAVQTQNESEKSFKDSGSSKVNINTADKATLMTLSGIGEARAESIIKYRESNGDFSSIEDIKNVTGIKEGLFSKISNDITV